MTDDYECEFCGWSGPGGDTRKAGLRKEIRVLCPKCGMVLEKKGGSYDLGV